MSLMPSEEEIDALDVQEGDGQPADDDDGDGEDEEPVASDDEPVDAELNALAESMSKLFGGAAHVGLGPGGGMGQSAQLPRTGIETVGKGKDKKAIGRATRELYLLVSRFSLALLVRPS